jgi:hypothetical protein
VSSTFAPLLAHCATADDEIDERDVEHEAAMAALHCSVGALEAAVSALEAERALLDARYRDDAAQFLIRFLESCAPAICDASAIGEIGRLFGPASKPAPVGPIEIRAHGEFIEIIDNAFGVAGRSPPCTLTADPDMRTGAVEATWSGGGLSIDTPAAIRAVTEILTAQAGEAGHESRVE